MNTKKIYTRILAAVVCIFFSIVSAESQVSNWTSVGPIAFPSNLTSQINGIGRISQLKFDPVNRARIYAVAPHAVFVSNDSTNTWSVLPGTDVFPTGMNLASICIDYTNTSTLYLGTGDANYYSTGAANASGVWKSTDGGNSFVQINNGMGNVLVIDIIMSPTDHNTLVAATSNGIWKTTNGGTTWTQTLVGGNFTSMQSNAGHNSQTLYGATNTDASLYRSTDFGNTWTANNIGGTLTKYGGRVAVTPADTTVVYVSYIGSNSTTGGLIYRSSDGGQTFTQKKGDTSPNLNGYTSSTAGQGNYNWAMCADPNNANTVYAVGHLIWKSTDGGANFTQMESSWSVVIHTDMHGIVFNPWNSTQLFDINDGGVWINTDGTAQTWTPKCQGLVSSEFYHMANSHINGNVIGGGLQDNGEVFLKNGTWYCNRGGDWGQTYYTDYVTNYMYYLGKGQRRDVYNSPTSTAQSLGFPTAFTSSSSDVMAFSNVNTNVAFWSPNPLTSSQNASYQTLDGFYVTTSLSSNPPTWTWTQFNGNQAFSMAASYGVDSLFILYNDGSFTRVANASGLGGTRSIVNTSSNFVSSTLGVASFNSGALATTKNGKVYLAAGGYVFKSSDNGNTWTAVGSGEVTTMLKGQKILKIIADTTHTSREAVYAATSQAVYYIDNNLSDWAFFSTSLPATSSITGLDIFYDTTNLANSLLRVSTYGRGVWRVPVASTTPIVPPMVSISSPTNSASFPVNSNITINATASSPNPGGSIAKVDFYQGSTLLGTSTTSPYSVTWNNVAKGIYSLKSVATDNGGLTTTSSLVTIGVGEAPFAPVADAYVRNGTYATNNFGADTGLAVKNDGTSYYRESYLRFDFNAYTGTSVDSAKFKIYASSVGANPTRIVSVYSISDTTWGEASITYNNQPTDPGTLIGNDTVTNVGNVWYQLDVTSYINSQLAAGHKKVSFRLINNGTASSSGDVSFNSREATANNPQLLFFQHQSANQPPTVAITAPANNSDVETGSNVTISANASSPNSGGSIVKVDFYSGSSLLGTSTTSPYSYAWNNVVAGKDTLTAIATDNTGLTTTSSAINLTVSAPPAVSITSPTNNSVVAAGSNVTISANASSPNTGGTIAKVDFYSGSTLLGTSTTSPYSYTWNNVVAGKDTLTAVATDNIGLTTTSSAINLTVSSTPPTVSITAPVNNSVVAAGSNVTISANASSPGSISKVDFYNGSTLLGTSTASPYSNTWNTIPAGSYTLTAVATDNNGLTTTSAAVNIQAEIATFTPVADAYVRNGTYASTNYGTATTLVVKNDGTSYYRESYLRFDFSNFTGTSVANAKLKLYVSTVNTAASRIVSVYGITDNTWGETTITYSNQPTEAGTLIGNDTISNVSGLWYQLDITSYINSQLAAGNKIVSLRLINNGAASSNGDVTFNSREASSNNPQLVFTPQGQSPMDTFAPLLSANTVDPNNNGFDVKVYPNPSATAFKLAFTGADASAKTDIYITDLYGRTVKTFSVAPGSTIQFGNDLRPGNYFVVVWQGKNKKVLKIIKL
jgi:photosystem II stability/assembly factor-like uncharacterized protein